MELISLSKQFWERHLFVLCNFIYLLIFLPAPGLRVENGDNLNDDASCLLFGKVAGSDPI
jgi:hypothetical protein